MKIGIIQAHMGSKRLPGKVMKKVQGKTILEHVYDRAKKSKILDLVVIATSLDKDNDIIEELCKEKNIQIFRGSEEDVLDRYYVCANKYKADTIVRITSDCPLIEPKLIDYYLTKFDIESFEFVDGDSELYLGSGIDIFSMRCLEKLKKRSISKRQKEHVVGYYLENKNEFLSQKIKISDELKFLLRNYRLTLDEIKDFEIINYIYEKFYFNGYVDLKKVIEFLDDIENESILKINSNIKQKKY